MRPGGFLTTLHTPRSRRFQRAIASLGLLLSCLIAAPALGQYMYLDSNGDGVHTAADVVNPTAPTTLDIWIRTDANRDGAAALCASGDGPLDIRSYQVILHATEGTVSWSPYVNAQSQAFPSNFGSEFDTTDAFVSFSGFTALAPGAYKLGTITLTVRSGTPSLKIAPGSSLSDGYLTAFGSNCSGSDFDGFIKMGPNVLGPGDWTDADGLEYGGTALHAPVLAPVADPTVNEGQIVDVPLSATDQDGDPLTFSKVSGPSFMQVTTSSPGIGTATGVLHLSPGFTDAGTSSASIAVSDGAREAQAAFTITVREVDRPPVLSQPRDVVVEENGADVQGLSATDPDGQLVFITKESGPAYVQLFGSGARVTLLVVPFGDFGGRLDTVVVAANSGMLQDRKSFRVTVKSLPDWAQPSDMTVLVNTTADQILSAVDLDGDPLTFSKESGPYFVAITTTSPGTGSASGLVHVSPGEFDAGHYTVTIGLNDGLGSVSASFLVNAVNPVGGGPSAEGLFTSRFRPFDAGPRPSVTVSGDLNRDGLPDIVVAGQDPPYPITLSVLLGTTAGILSTPIPITVSNLARSLALADLNGDGVLDLAVALNNDGVGTLLGRGDGTFAPSVLHPAGNCTAVATGDWNQDGRIDLAATSNSGGFLRTWLNPGDGSFDSFHDAPTDRYPLTIASGDLDLDGRQDLAISDVDAHSIGVFRGAGDGTFERISTLSDAQGDLAIRDLNGDGFQDLVAVSGAVSIFLGSSTGLGSSRQDFSAGPAAVGAAVGDFNRDGLPDIAVANVDADSASILVGDGTGRFTRQITLATGARPSSILAADFNRDGMPDLLTPNQGSGTVAIALSQGNGTFGDARSIARGGQPGQVVSGDFNADGLVELGRYDSESGAISILNAVSGGNVPPFSTVPARVYGRSLTAGDLNGDGRADLIWADAELSSVSLVLSTPGGWGARRDIGYVYGLHSALTLADWNRDGHIDVAVASTSPDFSEHALLFPGHGDGTFDAASDIPLGFWGATALRAGDLNGDGFFDLVSISFQSPTVCAPFLGHGDGTFTPAAPSGAGHGTGDVQMADLSGDGILDLEFTSAENFFSDPSPGVASVVLGRGDGTFGDPTDFATGYTPQATAIADFNSDGRLDLAVTNGDGNSVSVLLGNGGGTFGAKVDFGVGRSPSDIITADLNGDGRPDLVTCDRASGTLTLLENRGTVPPNRAPTAVAGGPYSGVVDVPVTFHGTESSDPDGNALSFHWTFGDGNDGTGAEPAHTYNSGGHFDVSLTVGDGSLEGRDSTEVEITAALPARAFVAEGRHPVIVGGGAPFTYVEVEPVGSAYENSDVITSSLRLQSAGTGSVAEIATASGKRVGVIDRDENGIFEISSAFAREDLARLFSLVTKKRQVPVVLEGTLTGGARFHAALDLTVLGHGGPPFSAVSSNPIRSGGTLTLFQPSSGPLRVQIFDAAGRLVRTLVDLPVASSGFVDLPLDGRSSAGARLPSGIYFYKIVTTDGNATGRVVILR